MSSADPLSYLFGIIKYISNHVNANNNNNNIIANDRVIKAFGPCVRSILRKEEYSDIYLIISCRTIINEFIALLKLFEVISRNIEIDVSRLLVFHIHYRSRTYTIHLGTDIYKFMYYMNNRFGITCDNLSIDYDGNISTVISHHLVKVFNNITWVTSCVQDVISGKFRVIVLEDIFHSDAGFAERSMSPFDKIILQNDMVENIMYMGFKFDRENSKNLTSYRFYELISHTEIKNYDKDRDISMNCCICREDYLENTDKKTILIGCHHDFHIDCLQKWVNTNKKTCPTCRTGLHFL